jgi:DNA-binding CsgD family transcriptional regulator
LEFNMGLSKTQTALALVKDGVAVKAAAERAGIAESTLRMAIGRTKGKIQCPCCGQVVREGFEVDRDVLKDVAE